MFPWKWSLGQAVCRDCQPSWGLAVPGTQTPAGDAACAWLWQLALPGTAGHSPSELTLMGACLTKEERW